MIKETYCSYEVAKILKEKAFNESCYTCYVEKEISHYDYSSTNYELIDGVISCPTIQMAMKWLREIYGIDIVIEISDPSVNDRKYYCVIWDKNNDSYILDLFDSYEDAVEAALKYCLKNLI